MNREEAYLDQYTYEHLPQAIALLDSDEWLQLFHPPVYPSEYEEIQKLRLAVSTVLTAFSALCGPQPDPTTGLVPCGCKYCDSTHGQRYLFRENKNAPYRGMISTVEITEDDCKKYSQIEGNLYDENGNNFYFVFDIRHCPMCGRELQVAL